MVFSDVTDKKRERAIFFANTSYGNGLSKVVKSIVRWAMDVFLKV